MREHATNPNNFRVGRAVAIVATLAGDLAFVLAFIPIGALRIAWDAIAAVWWYFGVAGREGNAIMLVKIQRWIEDRRFHRIQKEKSQGE
jgi:hypothetical protein